MAVTKIERSDLLPVFEALNLPKAPDWDNDTMQTKAAKRFKQALADKEVKAALDADVLKVCKQVVKLEKDGAKWKVVGEDDAEESNGKSKKNGKAKSKKGDGPAKKMGVIAYLIELLEAASEEKPLTEEKAVAALHKKFNDREEVAIRTTFKNQIGYQLPTVKGLPIKNDGERPRGYWMGRKGKKK